MRISQCTEACITRNRRNRRKSSRHLEEFELNLHLNNVTNVKKAAQYKLKEKPTAFTCFVAIRESKYFIIKFIIKIRTQLYYQILEYNREGGPEFLIFN